MEFTPRPASALWGTRSKLLSLARRRQAQGSGETWPLSLDGHACCLCSSRDGVPCGNSHVLRLRREANQSVEPLVQHRHRHRHRLKGRELEPGRTAARRDHCAWGGKAARGSASGSRGMGQWSKEAQVVFVKVILASPTGLALDKT